MGKGRGKGGEDEEEGCLGCMGIGCLCFFLFGIAGASMVGENGRMRDYNIAECDRNYVQAECKVLAHESETDIVESNDDNSADSEYYYVKTDIELLVYDLNKTVNWTSSLHWEYIPAYTTAGIKQGIANRINRAFDDKSARAAYKKKFKEGRIYKCFYDETHPKSVTWNCSPRVFQQLWINGWVLLALGLCPFGCMAIVAVLACLAGCCTCCMEVIEEAHFFEHHAPPQNHTVHRALSRMHSHTTDIVAMHNGVGAGVTRQTSRGWTTVKDTVGTWGSKNSSLDTTTDEPDFMPPPSAPEVTAPAALLSYEDSMAAVSNASNAQDLAAGLTALIEAIERMPDQEVQSKAELKVPAFTSLMKAKKDAFDYFSVVEYNTSCRPKVNQLMRLMFDKHSSATAAGAQSGVPVVV